MTTIIIIPDNIEPWSGRPLISEIKTYLDQTHIFGRDWRKNIHLLTNIPEKEWMYHDRLHEKFWRYHFILIPESLWNHIERILNVSNFHVVRIKDKREMVVGLSNSKEKTKFFPPFHEFLWRLFWHLVEPVKYFAFIQKPDIEERLWEMQTIDCEFDLIEMSRFDRNDEGFLSAEDIHDPKSLFWRNYKPISFLYGLEDKEILSELRESLDGTWVKITMIGTQPYVTNSILIESTIDMRNLRIDRLDAKDRKSLLKIFKFDEEMIKENDDTYENRAWMVNESMKSICEEKFCIIVNRVWQGLAVSYEVSWSHGKNEIIAFYDVWKDGCTPWKGSTSVRNGAVVILSHFHHDHYDAFFKRGIVTSLKRKDIFWILPLDKGSLKASAVNLLAHIKSKGNFLIAKPWNNIFRCKKMEVWALPDNPFYKNQNNRWIFIYHPDGDYLLSWDAEYKEISKMIGKPLKFKTVVATHHGWRYWGKNLPTANRVIFSYGKNKYGKNRYWHPDPQKKDFTSQPIPPSQDDTIFMAQTI